MRVVFMGTPAFSVPVLEALHARHEVVCAYSQPPRPAGRGKKDRPSPVQERAEALGIPVRHPVRLRDAAEQADFAALHADVAVVVAYGLILPKPILEAPRLGCLNIHASLLPRWRGAAPIHRAIMAGDAATGVCIMQMDEGLDTGPMLLARSIPILPADTTASLHDRLAALGGECIVAALAALRRGELAATPQPAAGVTYAAKIGRAEAAIDWTRPAAGIERALRAFDPFPGAASSLRGTVVKCWSATVVPGAGAPGTVLAVGDDGITVACGRDALRCTVLQRPGSKRLPAGEFLRGFPVSVGERFATPA